MRFLSRLVLLTPILPSTCSANVFEHRKLAESNAYISTGVAASSSYTISTRSSIEPTLECTSPPATSRNTTGARESQIFQRSLCGSGTADPTGLTVVKVHTNLTSLRPSTRPTSDRSLASFGTDEWGILSSHTSQDSLSTTCQTSCALRSDVNWANTTSTLASIPAAASARNEPFAATSGLIWSQESVRAQLRGSMSNKSKSHSAKESPYSATAWGTGSFTTHFNYSLEGSSTSSKHPRLAAVTSVPGPNGNITTSQRESSSSQISRRAGAAASTAATTENKDSPATTTLTKSTNTPITNLSSGLAGTTTSVGTWPATISFCSLSDGVAGIGVGYVTTLADGKSSVTNTSPSQSLISASAGSGCAGEVAVFSDGLTNTIQLAALPSASAFPTDEAQIVTQSGSVVQYIAETLSGYDNAQPIEISTNFVEVINGKTTTQGGWWLIGAYGHIEIPKDHPWHIGKGIGCIGGPALCNMPCGAVDVGLDLFVLIDHDDCTTDETGPPGYPGGVILDIDPIPDPPYPQEGEGADDPEQTKSPGRDRTQKDPDKKTATKKDGPTTTAEDSTLASRPRSMASSFTVSSASHISSSSAAATEYMIVAAVGADQTNIQQTLQEYDPERGGSYAPDVGDTPVRYV